MNPSPYEVGRKVENCRKTGRISTELVDDTVTLLHGIKEPIHQFRERFRWYLENPSIAATQFAQMGVSRQDVERLAKSISQGS